MTELLDAQLPSPRRIYACGPEPMLVAVGERARRRDVPTELALETAMACGFGACWGCVVATARRLPPHLRRRSRVSGAVAAGMIELCGIELRDPVINASGCFDALAAERVFGESLRDAFPFAAYVSKTITLAPREGNPPPRLWEAAAGLVNSIGLPNRGLHAYLEQDLPRLAQLPVPLITNVMGSTAGEFAELVAALDGQAAIRAVELNVSCPNVATGLDIGADPRELQALLDHVRPFTAKPLIVKLTPNTADVAACAAGAEAGGADAVSLINTLRARPLAPGAAEPWLGAGAAACPGPAIRTVALAQVAAVAARVEIPVVGMGGIASGADARAMLDAGATVVAIGTECFRDPAAATPHRRAAGGRFPVNCGKIAAHCHRHQFKSPAKKTK